MPISFKPNENKAILDEKDVVVHELIIDDLIKIITEIDLSGANNWQSQAPTVFYSVMNKMITVDGKRVNPSELGRYPVDFFIEVLKLSFPYIKDTILLQLPNLLSMVSVSQKSED